MGKDVFGPKWCFCKNQQVETEARHMPIKKDKMYITTATINP